MIKYKGYFITSKELDEFFKWFSPSSDEEDLVKVTRALLVEISLSCKTKTSLSFLDKIKLIWEVFRY